MAKSLLAAALTVVGVAALWVWTREPAAHMTARPARPVSAAPPPRSVDSERRGAIAAALRRAPAPPADVAPPPSLQDTEIDGALAVDANGELIVSPALRRFFEYFFVATGELSEERIRARIASEVAARASGVAQQRALDLLDRYVAYRARGRTLAEAGVDGDLAARADALRTLRSESFGEQDAAALFGDEETIIAVAVEQRRVAADPSLSDGERAARIAALEASLPAAEREARAAAMAPLRLSRDEAALRDAGGSPEEIRALREQAVGTEAADRLAALDQRRAEWQARVAAYRQARAAIDQDASLSPEQRESALEALRVHHFNETELARIRALDRIEP